MKTLIVPLVLLIGLVTVPAASAECVEEAGARTCVSVYGPGSVNGVGVNAAAGDDAEARGHVGANRNFFGDTTVGGVAILDAPVAGEGGEASANVGSSNPPRFLTRVIVIVGTSDGDGGESERTVIEVRDANGDGVPETVTLPALLP